MQESTYLLSAGYALLFQQRMSCELAHGVPHNNHVVSHIFFHSSRNISCALRRARAAYNSCLCVFHTAKRSSGAPVPSATQKDHKTVSSYAEAAAFTACGCSACWGLVAASGDAVLFDWFHGASRLFCVAYDDLWFGACLYVIHRDRHFVSAQGEAMKIKRLWPLLLLVIFCLSAAEDTASQVLANSEYEHTGRTVNHFLSQQYQHAALAQPITLHLKKVSRHQLVCRLAAYAGLNVVCEQRLTGTVPHVCVKHMPIGQLLNLILAGQSTAMSILIVDGVLHIGPRATLRRRAQQLLTGTTLPTEQRRITVVHRPWHETVKIQLEALWHQAGREYIDSSRTHYFFLDDTTKSVLVQGSPERVAYFAQLVAVFDVPIPQVCIQARVVTVATDFIQQLGVRVRHPHLSLDTAGEGVFSIPFVLSAPASTQLHICLDMAERRQRARTLLAPQLLSKSGQKAQLLQGQRVPIATTTEEQTDGKTKTVHSAQYKEVGMQLQVMPRVLPNHEHVSLDVLVELSALAGTSVSKTHPTITTSRIKNSVQLRSGQTVLLGGLIRRHEQSQRRGVPWLSRLPLIGALFGGGQTEQREERLYVCLTATVL